MQGQKVIQTSKPSSDLSYGLIMFYSKLVYRGIFINYEIMFFPYFQTIQDQS